MTGINNHWHRTREATYQDRRMRREGYKKDKRNETKDLNKLINSETRPFAPSTKPQNHFFDLQVIFAKNKNLVSMKSLLPTRQIIVGRMHIYESENSTITLWR